MVLVAPTNLHSTAVTSTSVSLAWNAVTGASGYEISVVPASTGTWLSGAGANDTISDGTFGTWRGRAVDIASTWADNDAAQVALWQLDPGNEYGSWQGNLEIAVGAFDSGESWSAAASGSYDSRWSQCLTNLKTKWTGRPGTLYIRFAHEMNGNWYPWSVTTGNYVNFIAAWKRFRSLQQSIFPASKLVFSANRESVGLAMDWRTTFPGAAYVDNMSVDYYNHYPSVITSADWDNCVNQVDSYGAPKGLQQHLNFAASQGMGLGVSEWSGHYADSGDCPMFFQRMHDFFVTNGGTGAGKILYEMVFNTDSPSYNGNFGIYPVNLMPNSSATYASLW